MERLKLKLTGYFDNNFGDDYIMRIIVRSLPEIDFVIDKRESKTEFLQNEKNVIIEENPDKYPVLNVTGSGFMINSKRALFTEIVWFLKRKKSGDYCLGCNIEPLGNGLKKFLISSKLNKYKLIVCRDKKSYEWLNSNIKTHIEYLPDILFGLPEEFLPSHRTAEKLGISCIHRSGEETDSEYYKKMADIADFWIENTQKEVLLLAFDSGEEDDIYACENIKRRMRNQGKVKIIAHKNGEEIFYAYGECAKIIGARFHSVVLGMKMNIPVFPLIFRDKTKNLITDTNYPQKGCSIDGIDVEKIKNFLQDNTEEIKIDIGYKKTSNVYAEVLRESLDKE